MITSRQSMLSWCIWLWGMLALQGAEPIPPLIQTTGASTVANDGRAWLYITLGENRPGLLRSRSLNVYAKSGTPDSPALFTARGTIGAATDPTAIGVLLNRGKAVGDDLGALEAEMVAIHQWLLNRGRTPSDPPVTAPFMPLAQRIATLSARASQESSLAQWLDLGAFAHPTLRLIRGTAWAGPAEVPVGGTVTVEVREADGSDTGGLPIARLTLVAGQREQLPAPGPVVAVPDPSAGGDLAFKLRWATPPALTVVGSRHQGDIVWRITKTVAESRGFHTTPPDAAALDALALSTPSVAQRVASRVIPTPAFTAATVGDFSSDSVTAYLLDDNHRHASGGLPFQEGSQYYYFVAAADALGRPGKVSDGLLVTACRQVPPPLPTHLSVKSRWSPDSPTLLWDVSWLSNPIDAATSTDRYELYRGNDLSQLAAAQQGSLDLTADPIVAGNPWAIQKVGEIPDPAAPSPQTIVTSLPADGPPGAHWWFAVRAIHQTPPGCPTIASPFSPPVMRVVPEHGAPITPTPDQIAAPVVQCLRVGCIQDLPPNIEVSATDLDVRSIYFVSRCTRRPGIIAAHFLVLDSSDGSTILPETSVVFAAGENDASIDWSLPSLHLGHTLDVQCRVEGAGGVLSHWAHASVSGVQASGNQIRNSHFLAGAIATDELASAPGNDPLWSALRLEAAPPCAEDVHFTVSPFTGRILHPVVTLPLAPDSAQFRIYRQLDDGPLLLFHQGLQRYAGPGSKVSITDSNSPVCNGEVRYYGQLLDKNGNPSATMRLGKLQFTGDTVPEPVLFTPLPTAFGGDPSAPTVTLTWICPPEHVERFEIFFDTVLPATDPHLGISKAAGSLRYITQTPTPHPIKFTVRSKEGSREAKVVAATQSFLTGRVGGDLGAGPRFNFPLQVDPSLRYSVWMRALGPHGEVSEISRTITFQWQLPAPQPTDVPWPARPLPSVGAFHHGIQVVDFSDISPDRLLWETRFNANSKDLFYSLDTNASPVGIRIGSVPIDFDPLRSSFSSDPAAPGPAIRVPVASKLHAQALPDQQVFHHETDASQSLFPFVLYRQQVPNEVFPAVSQEVVQCSPLIRSIASAILFADARQERIALIDPLFRWVGPLAPDAPQLDLYLVDTQPVVSDSRYRYWLVRFSVFGEPIQTIPCGEVTVR